MMDESTGQSETTKALNEVIKALRARVQYQLPILPAEGQAESAVGLTPLDRANEMFGAVPVPGAPDNPDEIPLTFDTLALAGDSPMEVDPLGLDDPADAAEWTIEESSESPPPGPIGPEPAPPILHFADVSPEPDAGSGGMAEHVFAELDSLRQQHGDLRDAVAKLIDREQFLSALPLPTDVREDEDLAGRVEAVERFLANIDGPGVVRTPDGLTILGGDAGEDFTPKLIPDAGIGYYYAYENWTRAVDPTQSYVRCYRTDSLAHETVGDESVTVMLPPIFDGSGNLAREGNVRLGMVILGATMPDGTIVGVGDIYDDAVGTVKAWQYPDAIPPGWQIWAAAERKSIKGYDSESADYDEIGVGAGADTHGGDANDHKDHDLEHYHGSNYSTRDDMDPSGACTVVVSVQDTDGATWNGTAVGGEKPVADQAQHTETDNRSAFVAACWIERVD